MAYVVTGVLGSSKAKLGLFVLGVYQRVIGGVEASEADAAYTWSAESRGAAWSAESRPTEWVAS